jgi:hypothetical protein
MAWRIWACQRTSCDCRRAYQRQVPYTDCFECWSGFHYRKPRKREWNDPRLATGIQGEGTDMSGGPPGRRPTGVVTRPPSMIVTVYREGRPHPLFTTYDHDHDLVCPGLSAPGP